MYRGSYCTYHTSLRTRCVGLYQTTYVRYIPCCWVLAKLQTLPFLAKKHLKHSSLTYWKSTNQWREWQMFFNSFSLKLLFHTLTHRFSTFIDHPTVNSNSCWPLTLNLERGQLTYWECRNLNNNKLCLFFRLYYIHSSTECFVHEHSGLIVYLCFSA
jgi:hypothetical protein